MNGTEAYKRLQSAARSLGAKTGKKTPTEEYLIRHALESFLDRLTRTRGVPEEVDARLDMRMTTGTSTSSA
jgi:hypothetical protein